MVVFSITVVTYTSYSVKLTEVKFAPTLIMKLPYLEVKSQTCLSSLRVSCKRALSETVDIFLSFEVYLQFLNHWNLSNTVTIQLYIVKNGEFKEEKIIAF